MLPKPWQVGQAPNGLLNENSRGCGSSYAMPHARHSKRSGTMHVGPSGWRLGAGTGRAEAGGWRLATGDSTAHAAPPPSRYAVSIESVSRWRRSSPDPQRSARDRRRPAASSGPRASAGVDVVERHRALADRPAGGRSPFAGASRSSPPRRRRRARRGFQRRSTRRRGSVAGAARLGELVRHFGGFVHLLGGLGVAPGGASDASTTGRSKPISSRVPAGSVPSCRATTSAVSRTTSWPHCGRTCGRRARTAAACSRESRSSCRPSSADCGCCSSGGWRSPGEMPSMRSTSGFSIRSRNCRA